MFQIINRAGLIADLYPKTSITVERNNPLFNDNDKFFEDITYGFSVPDTDHNREFFGSGHLIEAENMVYEQDIQTVYSGGPFYAGKIAYSYTDGEFNTLLKVNFGALSDNIKNVKLSDIFTGDALQTTFTAAYMKTVCENPLDYPYSFFPVFNDRWAGGDNISFQPMINYWDHSAQTFSQIANIPGVDASLACPFWKVKHYILKAMEYLGLECRGSWMDDPANEEIYIYTRISKYDFTIYESVVYLPEKLTIADLFKLLKERFGITFNFNLFKGEVTIQTAKDLLSSTDFIDISGFVSDVNEITVPETKGYTIILKADDQDELFKDPVNPEKYIPTNRLVVGTGETEIEIESSTLKKKTVDDYSMPTARQRVYLSVTENVPDYPIRFLRFTGMKSVAGSKVFPEAKPIELDTDDAIWYRFLNDSKPVKITAFLPPYLLIELDSSKIISFVSRENSYQSAMIEKITFNIGNNDDELVEVTIDCRTKKNDQKTAVYVEPFTTFLEGGFRLPKFKAFFSDTSYEEIQVDIFYEKEYNGSNSDPGHNRLDTAVILKSTDKFGVGGTVTAYPSVNVVLHSLIEVRVKTGVPKYAVMSGVKMYFTLRDGYYFSNAIVGSDAWLRGDRRPVWIVF